MTDTGRLLQQLRLDREQRTDPPTLRRGRWLAGAMLLGLPLAAGVAALVMRRSARFEVDTAIAVAPSAGRGPTATLQATGYVTARRRATVSAQITGRLTEVLIEEGEHVKAGQVLARLDNTAQMAALAEAQAHVNAARALLGQYEAQLAQARRDLTRQEALVARQIVSQQEFETARTQVEVFEAQVATQGQQVALAQAAVRGAEVELRYTTVRAPFSGVIVDKAAQAGEIVSPISAGGGFTRTGVGTIVDMSSLEIEVDITEGYLNRITADQPAHATLDAYPGWTIPAHVIAIIPTADRSKATVKVRVAIEQKDPRILPDMGVRVSFLEDAPKKDAADTGSRASPPKGVLVPGTAIVERGGQSVVFTVDGDRARAQPVTAGQTYGDLRLIEGVPNGATVVRLPPAEMTDGARILAKKQ